MPQYDLEGTEIKKEIVKSTKAVYHGKFYDLTVTEGGEDQLEKLADKGVDTRHWIACHMKLKEKLTVNHEGKCFQDDLEEFKKALK